MAEKKSGQDGEEWREWKMFVIEMREDDCRSPVACAMGRKSRGKGRPCLL